MKNTKYKIIILSLITIVILFFMLKDDFSSIINILMSANILYIFATILVIILGDIFKSISISSIAKKFKNDYHYYNGFKLTLKTNFFNGITPFSLGGQPFQLYSMKKTNNIDYVTSANILFEDFYTYQIALMLLVTIFIIVNYFFNFVLLDNISNQLLIFGIIINTIVALFLICIPYINSKNHIIVGIISRLICKFKKNLVYEEVYTSLINKLDEFRTRIKQIRKDPLLIIKAVILNIIKMLSVGFAIYFSTKAIGVNLNIMTSLITSIYIVTMASFVPIPGASGGVEYSYSLLLLPFILNDKLIPSLILWRFASYYLPIIFGGIMFAVEDSKNI